MPNAAPLHRSGIAAPTRGARNRGYDRAWERFRRWYLNAHPVCEDCDRLAQEVHHVVKLVEAPERRLDPTNVMALCKRCHSRRTARGE